MKESAPLMIRYGDYLIISNNVFDGNKAGSYGGDTYFASAIMLQQMYGFNNVTITGCTFKNHKGFTAAEADASQGLYEGYHLTPLISYNFMESLNVYPSTIEIAQRLDAPSRNDAKITV